MRANLGKDGSMVHVWTEKHTQESDAGVNVCGGTTPDDKFSSLIDVVLPHSAASIKLGFGSTMTIDDPMDASWGISALELYVK